MTAPLEKTAPKIESDDLSLGDLFKDFYCVPDFQREYVWEPQNVEKLLTDVLDEFYDDENRLSGDSEYFIGSVVACLDSVGTYQLIDGQQRLTTIYLVVCAIRDKLVELGEPTTVALQGFIKAVSMDRRTMADISRYRLALQYEDSHGVLEILADARMPASNIPATTESIKHIVAAYQAIREFIGVNLNNDAERIKSFLAAFMYRVKLIRIITPNLAHALKVFETINDRGIGLNAMDLLKNLLFMRTTPADYPKLKGRWKELIDTLGRAGEKPLRFLRYYIMSHHEIDLHRGLREDEIYSWFVSNTKACGIDGNPLGFLDELVFCGRAYEQFLTGNDANCTPVPYLQNISLLAGGAVRQHLILLLAGQHLPPALFAELCRNIENLFFAYVITREPTKYFERNFARWSKGLRAVKDAVGLAAFVAENFHKDMATRSNAFDFAIRDLAMSKIQQYRLRYILAKMTQFIEQAAFGNPAFASLGLYINGQVDIEHILPRNPTAAVREAFDKVPEYDAYVQRLGNLTLLEKPINIVNSNRPFQEKRIGYCESRFLLTKALDKKPAVGRNSSVNRAVKDLPEFDGWDSTAIERRQNAMVMLAQRVWMADVAVAGA